MFPRSCACTVFFSIYYGRNSSIKSSNSFLIKILFESCMIKACLMYFGFILTLQAKSDSLRANAYFKWYPYITLLISSSQSLENIQGRDQSIQDHFKWYQSRSPSSGFVFPVLQLLDFWFSVFRSVLKFRSC